MSDPFLFEDAAMYVRDKLNPYLRRQFMKGVEKGPSVGYGRMPWPKVKLVTLREHLKMIYTDEKASKEFWTRHEKTLKLWATKTFIP
jgi:hypothetical protein